MGFLRSTRPTKGGYEVNKVEFFCKKTIRGTRQDLKDLGLVDFFFVVGKASARNSVMWVFFCGFWREKKSSYNSPIMIQLRNAYESLIL